MKVREAIKLIEQDGWYLTGRAAVTGTSNIGRNYSGSRRRQSAHSSSQADERPKRGLAPTDVGGYLNSYHRAKPGIVTIAGHPGVDIPKGTLNSILKQAGLKD